MMTELPPPYTATHEVLRAIVSQLTVASAPGLNGMTAHLLKPIFASVHNSDAPGVDSLAKLTKFINVMLQMSIFQDTAANFCWWATLVGIDKLGG